MEEVEIVEEKRSLFFHYLALGDSSCGGGDGGGWRLIAGRDDFRGRRGRVWMADFQTRPKRQRAA
jgi:hypothetical protein